MSIFKDCDIRGIYNEELFSDDGYRVGRALGTMVEAGATVRVGGDVRVSTPELKESLIRGLIESGARVEDMGTIATPVMYYAIHGAACAGAMVTASHNPAKYNGIKFMLDDMPVTRKTMDEIEAIIASGAYREGHGARVPLDILPDYCASLVRRFGTSGGAKVVVDAGNGAMSDIAPGAFEQCGYRVEPLFCTPDGTFPNRSPNPAEYDKLTALKSRVIETGADFGVAFDGDGDRAVFVDDQGEAVLSERAFVLFIRHLLASGPSCVVYDQKSSSVVARAIRAMGGTPVPERSGHTFIKRRFLQAGAAVAGEVSGHFFFGELGYDDGLFAALLMGELLKGRRMSDLLRDVVCPPITPDLRIEVKYREQDALLGRVESAYAGRPIGHLDGISVELEDGWFLLRKSVTAEQMTLRIEGEDQAALERIKRDLARRIPEMRAVLA